MESFDTADMPYMNIKPTDKGTEYGFTIELDLKQENDGTNEDSGKQ